ncbi:MAG: Carboxyl-terminal protease [Firmicutes bacterium]|nr:Carboxyl-terminal protease [Bacillota bacterium]
MISRLKTVIGAVALVVITVLITVSVINFVSIPVPGGNVILSARDYNNLKEMNKLLGIKEFLKDYYYKDIDMDKLQEGAIRGMLESLEDPYTVFMNREEYDSFMTHTMGTYEGIGLVVEKGEDGYITVVAPIEDTPSERAGIKSADKILKVDHKDVFGDQLEQAVSMMKGPGGTKVILTIIREGVENPFDVTITREEIRLKTVKSQVLEDDIGYIRISTFDEKTYDDFNKALKDLSKSGIKGLLIDLRSNPGGLLDVVVDIADVLMGKGLIVYTEDRQGNRKEEVSDAGEIGLPMAVLVDGGSASASEILAGALQDSGTGVLVGTKTFGKALVQTVQELKDGTAIKVTIAQYYTPKGRSIQGKGIMPDYVVELPEDAVMGEYKQGRDPQMAKAIEIIKGRIR